MRQFGTILKFELRKILQRRGTWLAFGIVFLFGLLSEFSWLLNSTYESGVVKETILESTRKDRENGIRMSGRALDEALIEEIREAYAVLEECDGSDEVYYEKVRPYKNLIVTMQSMGYYYSGTIEGPMTAEHLYGMRQSALEERMESLRLGAAEKSYWQAKEDAVKKPFVYQYAQGYFEFSSMSGVYMICLYMIFFIAVCLSGVFTEEHTRKTDQLVLCSRLGRGEVYFAKLAAGTIVSLSAGLILLAVTAVGCFAVYGAEGFDACLQLRMPFYPYPLTVGQTALIMTGIYLLALIVTAVITMVLSELFRNGVASLATIVALTFLSRLVSIPERFRLLGMLRNCLALNILKLNEGFSDLRLFTVFGQKLTLWQMAPILYVLVGVTAVCFGKRIYARFQVEGR